MVLSKKNGARLQWLLNGFLFVSILHLVAVWGLGYLNERKQNAQKEEVRHEREGEDADEERRGASGTASGVDGPSSSPDLSPRGPSDQTTGGGHTTSPLLRPRGASLVYQSYGTHTRPRQPQDTTLMGATAPVEVRRGKLFASLCAATVVFAWALFLITSFVKIRSKREREGHS